MNAQQATEPSAAGETLRNRVLEGLPVTERRLEVAGVPTAVLGGRST